MSELHPSTYAIFSQYMWHVGSGACTAASQQEGHGFDPRMGRCWLWGAGPPQTSRWAICRAFLCGVCMFSQCPQEPQQHTLLSDQDGWFTSLGLRALKSCPGVLEEGQSGMGKCRSQIHGDC